MAIPWIDSVKQSGGLSVYIDQSVTGGWLTVVRNAIRDFNVLSGTKELGVTLTESSEAPAARGGGGANVALATGNGQISATYEGTTRTGSFRGDVMHGLTLQFQVGEKLEKAFVFLPSAPLVNTPRGRRPVGSNVMKIIAIHEFVHACGLSNAEHTTDDLFQGSPQVDPGDTALDDKVRIQTGRTMSWMPPLVLSGSTVRNIRSAWQTR